MLVKPLQVVNKDIVLVPGDWHFDEHDPEASWLMIKVARKVQPTKVVLVGDTHESAGISRHPGMRRRVRMPRGTIKAETAAARPYFAALREIVPAGGLHALTGNHEAWWEGVQEEYPGLEDIPWFELYDDLYDGWTIHKEYVSLKLGPLLICHGHRLRGSLSKYSAASVLANYPGQNTLYGHTHRVDSCTLPTHKYGVSQDHGAWTIGTLRCLESSLKDRFLGPHSERHKQGFALVHFTEINDEMFFKVTQVTIDRTSKGTPFCIYNGEVFTL